MKSIKTESFELAVYQRGNLGADKLALVLPGRLDTKDYVHMTSLVDFLASKGYLTLSFDPPGTWGSKGSIEDYTSKNYLHAIDELIGYFGNRPTLLVGHSRGGSWAMLAGINNPAVTKFVSIMSHFEDSAAPKVNNVVNVISYRDTPPGTERTKQKVKFELPLSYFEEKTDFIGLDTCTKPKLFIYGKKDSLVLPEDVINAYESAANPKILKEINYEHDYRLYPEAIVEVNKVIGEFLDV